MIRLVLKITAILFIYGIEVQAQNIKTFTYQGKGAFSISYPSDWVVQKTPNEKVKVSIFAPIVAGNNARTNINVVSSINATESIEEIFQISQSLINSNSQIFGNYRLVKKEDIILNNIKGIKIISTWRTNGVEIVGFQYILKKTDNTCYTITLTIRLSVDKREADIAESIIDSFNSEPYDNSVQRSTLSDTSSSNSSTTQQTLTTYTNQSRRFSIDYPRGWSVNANAQAAGVQGVAFLAPENWNNFRSNFNVITSNRTESVDRLVQITQQQISNSNVFAGYKLDTKEYVTINGINGIKIIASYRLSGYAVKGIQYTLKKMDNTTYIISFTVGEPSYQRDRNLVEDIIKSFKSL